MTGKGIIFTDVDGTLVYHQKFHSIRELRSDPDGTFLVQDPITGSEVTALDVSVPLLPVYLATSTYDLAHRLREKYLIIFTTGATEQTMRMRMRNLDFADGYILEHGGRILDAEFQEDEGWAVQLRPYIQTLQEIKAKLEGDGWTILDPGRETFLQVKTFENPRRSEAEFQEMCRQLALPAGFEKTFNLGNLTVVPSAAGKGKAVAYYLEKHPHLAHRSVGIGDDLNDLDFLKVCRQACVPGSALPEVIAEARREGWFVSSKPHFQGIDEILDRLLNHAID